LGRTKRVFHRAFALHLWLHRAKEVSECWTIDKVLEEERRQRRVLIYFSALAVRHSFRMRAFNVTR